MELIKKILQENTIPDRLVKRLEWNALSIAEKKLRDIKGIDAVDNELILDRSFYEKILSEISSLVDGSQTAAKFAAFVPSSIIGFKLGVGFPDNDIRIIGIGNHRYFLFHSGISVYIFKKMYDAYIMRSTKKGKPDKFVEKIIGVLIAGGAFGTGVHLLTDVFQPKSVVFPFFGSLVDGTLIDDDIWLLGNALWCFKLGKDLLITSIGDDLDRVKSFVIKEFAKPILKNIQKKKNDILTGN